MAKKREFTGFVIKENYDLKNLEKYGFYKTEPKNTNPWWQCPFDIKWGIVFLTWDCELLVSKKDRKLIAEYEDGCNLDKIKNTLEKMKQDDVFI